MAFTNDKLVEILWPVDAFIWAYRKNEEDDHYYSVRVGKRPSIMCPLDFPRIEYSSHQEERLWNGRAQYTIFSKDPKDQTHTAKVIFSDFKMFASNQQKEPSITISNYVFKEEIRDRDPLINIGVVENLHYFPKKTIIGLVTDGIQEIEIRISLPLLLPHEAYPQEYSKDDYFGKWHTAGQSILGYYISS